MHDPFELKAWIEAQNKITLGWLREGSDRRRIRARLKELWNYEKFSVPKVEGGKYVFRRNSGLENQAPLYIADTPDAEPGAGRVDRVDRAAVQADVLLPRPGDDTERPNLQAAGERLEEDPEVENVQ